MECVGVLIHFKGNHKQRSSMIKRAWASSYDLFSNPGWLNRPEEGDETLLTPPFFKIGAWSKHISEFLVSFVLHPLRTHSKGLHMPQRLVRLSSLKSFSFGSITIDEYVTEISSSKHLFFQPVYTALNLECHVCPSSPMSAFSPPFSRTHFWISWGEWSRKWDHCKFHLFENALMWHNSLSDKPKECSIPGSVMYMRTCVSHDYLLQI